MRKAWKRRVLETHPGMFEFLISGNKEVYMARADKLAQDITDEERQIAETQFREVNQT